MLLMAVIKHCHSVTLGEDTLKVYVEKHNLHNWQFDRAMDFHNATVDV